MDCESLQSANRHHLRQQRAFMTAYARQELSRHLRCSSVEGRDWKVVPVTRSTTCSSMLQTEEPDCYGDRANNWSADVELARLYSPGKGRSDRQAKNNPDIGSKSGVSDYVSDGEEIGIRGTPVVLKSRAS